MYFVSRFTRSVRISSTVRSSAWISPTRGKENIPSGRTTTSLVSCSSLHTEISGHLQLQGDNLDRRQVPLAWLPWHQHCEPAGLSPALREAGSAMARCEQY